MAPKGRLSASVDPSLITAAEDAVASGRAASVSAWVALAMQRQADHDARMTAGEQFFARFDEEFGPISDEEMQLATGDLYRRSRTTMPKQRRTPVPAAKATKPAPPAGAATNPTNRRSA